MNARFSDRRQVQLIAQDVLRKNLCECKWHAWHVWFLQLLLDF
jgi:hypothetical protein